MQFRYWVSSSVCHISNPLLRHTIGSSADPQFEYHHTMDCTWRELNLTNRAYYVTTYPFISLSPLSSKSSRVNQVPTHLLLICTTSSHRIAEKDQITIILTWKSIEPEFGISTRRLISSRLLPWKRHCSFYWFSINIYGSPLPPNLFYRIFIPRQLVRSQYNLMILVSISMNLICEISPWPPTNCFISQQSESSGWPLSIRCHDAYRWTHTERLGKEWRGVCTAGAYCSFVLFSFKCSMLVAQERTPFIDCHKRAVSD